MGIRDIKTAFNAVSAWPCTGVTMTMGRVDGAESQILTFRGRKPDGSPFEYVKIVSGSADVFKAARDAAAELTGS